MERLTKNINGMVWFASQDADLWLEPYEMSYHDNRIAIDKLAAYEDAVEKGHLVACPCKVGDMAYYIRGTTIYGDTVERIVIDGLDNQIILNANRAYLFCDVGSNLFFTYAEAEAALKKRKEG